MLDPLLSRCLCGALGLLAMPMVATHSGCAAGRPGNDGAAAGPASCTPPGRDADFNGPELSGAYVRKERSERHRDGRVPLALVSLADGVTLGGRVLRDAALTGTELKAGGLDSFGLIGALLLGRDADGEAVRLRVDAVSAAEDPRPETPENELAGVLLYKLSWQRGALVGEGAARRFEPAADFQPLCEEGQGALPLGGRWDQGRGRSGDGRRLSADGGELSFACPTGALYKCVRLGYRPWQGPALSRLHEACVRAVRADYCGNGVAMTEAGTEVNYYDGAGVQRDTRSWSFEAEWSPEGARCVRDARRGPAMLDYVQRCCPERARQRDCGPTAGKGPQGEVLYTEYNPAGAPQGK